METAQLLSDDLALSSPATPDPRQDEALVAAGLEARAKPPGPSWQRPHGLGAGLQNTGNSCYLNAALQCLTHTPPLAHYMLSRKHSRSCCHPAGCTMCALEAHMTRSLLHPGEVMQPSQALTAAFHKHRQEDAHEFLMFTLNAVHASCLQGSKPSEALSEDRTPIREIFGGTWRSQIKCLRCQGASCSFEPFLDIPLDISTAQSVHQALGALVRAEELRGANAYQCGHCREKTPASKTLRVQAAPKVLLLVLNRVSHFTGVKVHREVRYPASLDMRPYMSQHDGGPLVYALYAVLVHAGVTCHSGHYYCYVRASDRQWYKMDDSRVARCQVTSVLRESPYMLFYIQQSHLNKDSVEVPIGRVNQALGPVSQVGQAPQRNLGRGSRVVTAEPREHPDHTPPRKLPVDGTRVLQEHKRPHPVLNPPQSEPTLPARAVVIHWSRHRDHWARNNPDKENGPLCLQDAARFPSEQGALNNTGQLCSWGGRPGAKKKKKNKNKQGWRHLAVY